MTSLCTTFKLERLGLVSVAIDGSQGNEESLLPFISANGLFVTFMSAASNLVLLDENGNIIWDIFIHELSWESLPTSEPTPTSDSQWLLIYYQAGDNNLSDQMEKEVDEIIKVDNPNIDRAIFFDPKNSDSSFVYISADGEKTEVSQIDLNSGDSATLVDYVNWAKSLSNSTYVALILSDHGHALNGFGLDESSQDLLYVDGEFPQALNDAGPFDVIYLHACLMSNIEFLYQIRGSNRLFCWL